MTKHAKMDSKYFAERKILAEKYGIDWSLVDAWPLYAGLGNIGRSLAVADLVKELIDVPGDIAEFGSWRGANLVWMTKLLKLFDPYGNKLVHCFESFEGLSTFVEEDGEGEEINSGRYAGNYDVLMDFIDLYELNDDIRIHKGLIQDTLPILVEKETALSFSMLFCDTDLYEPTKLMLELLHDRLVKGGIVVFDEWNTDMWRGEGKAANEFMKQYSDCYEMRNVKYARQPTMILKKIKM